MTRARTPRKPDSAGWHFAAFAETFCRHTKGPFAGQPFVLEPWQREFVDEMFELDEHGRRVYKRVVLGIPRKNGKSTLCAGLSLYFGGPADGEASPQVIIAAGSAEQAGEVFNQAKEFIDHPSYGSRELAAVFVAQKASITCAENAGVIRRVSADGKTKHGSNPYAVIIDELHSFETPRQEELYRAMTTGQGAREEPMVVVITTAGSNLESILGRLYKQAQGAPEIERRHEGLWVARNRATGFLAYWYGIDPQLSDAELQDAALWKAANPAEWRTVERLQEDIDDEMVDWPTKLRLYGNRWTRAKARWISSDWWQAGASKEDIPRRGRVYIGVDVGYNFDTSSVCWAHPVLAEDGTVDRVIHRKVVWSVRPEAPHDRLCLDPETYEPADVVDYQEIEEFIVALGKRYRVGEIAFDPRHFVDTAQRLKKRGFRVVDIWPRSPIMDDAVQLYYEHVSQGKVLHDPADKVFDAHVEAAVAKKTDRGTWQVGKGDAKEPIDALMASVMAHHRAVNADDRSIYEDKDLQVLGDELEVDDEDDEEFDD